MIVNNTNEKIHIEQAAAYTTAAACCHKKRPELLSPAGSMDSFRAAIQAGADAVYTGLSKFSARASANNFSLDELSEAVTYAHLYGTKIYITLNTLVNDKELKESSELALAADRLGVDGFIIQDIGLAKLLSGKTNAALHASTQMTVYNADGLKMLKDLGFSRAVLARELSINEIASICKQDIMETEVFCHGALCISYSGQCMMSRFLTERSGNHGTCSQPCRLNYMLISPNENPSAIQMQPRLSPADLCSLPYLKELCSTGVTSLKIEGRLKSPEYTALVTEKYRKALDSNDFCYTQNDMDDLTVIFSRGGFTSGHQLYKMTSDSITQNKPGHRGLLVGSLAMPPKKLNGPVSLYKVTIKLDKNCLNVGDGITFDDKASSGGVINVITQKDEFIELTVAGDMPQFVKNLKLYKNYDNSLMKKFSKYYDPNAEIRKVKVSAVLSVFKGKPCVLSFTDMDGNIATAQSDTMCEHSENGIQKESVAKKINELGGTPFETYSIDIQTDGNSFAAFKVIKELRRRAAAQLATLRNGAPHNAVARQGDGIQNTSGGMQNDL